MGNPRTMGTVERYYAPLRSAYTKIRADLDSSVTDSDCLQLSVHSVNATVGLEELCPTVLFFVAIPRPARTRTAQSELDRARAIASSIGEMQKERARRRIEFGRKHTNSPKSNEDTNAPHPLPAGSVVYVYRIKSNQWEGHLYS